MNTGRLLKYGGKTRTKRAEDRKTKETEDWRAREIKSEIEKAILITTRIFVLQKWWNIFVKTFLKLDNNISSLECLFTYNWQLIWVSWYSFAFHEFRTDDGSCSQWTNDHTALISGHQSYKSSMIVNYYSRVELTRKLSIFLTLVF